MDAQLHVLSSDTHRKPGRKARLSYRHIALTEVNQSDPARQGALRPRISLIQWCAMCSQRESIRVEFATTQYRRHPNITARHTRTLHQSISTNRAPPHTAPLQTVHRTALYNESSTAPFPFDECVSPLVNPQVLT